MAPRDCLSWRHPRSWLTDDGFSDPQRLVEFETSARPHAARQRDGRQEAAALGMSVGSEFRLAHGRQEVKPVPERRQFIARPRLGVVAVERGGECCDLLRQIAPYSNNS